MKNNLLWCIALCITVPLCGRDTKMADQLHSYFIANYKHFGKEWQDALTWYKRTLQLNGPVFANKGLIYLLHETNNYPLVINFQQTIDKHFKEDIDIQFILAQSLAKGGQEVSAEERLLKLNQQKKNHPEIAFFVLQRHLQKNESEKALSVITTLLNNSTRKPTHFIFHFMKGQILAQMNKPEEALESIKASLDLHPNFDKGWLLQALLEEKLGRIDGAIKGFTTFLDLTGPNPEVEQQIIALTFKQKMLEQKSPTIVIPANCLEKTITLFKNKEYKKALETLQECLDTQPKNHEAQILKVQILSAMNEIDQALLDLKKWAVEEPSIPLWFDTLHLLYRDGVDPQKIIKVLKSVEKESSNQLFPTLYLADLFLRIHNTHAATTYLMRGLKLTESPDLQATLAFQLCALAYDNKQYKKVKELYQQYEQVAQRHAPFLNLMAYYYSHKEKNHTHAQQLVTKALKIEPHNHHIMDTQALIYYHQKQYDNAREILEKIAPHEQNDHVIAKHLAKTYYEIGDRQQAIQKLQLTITLVQDEYKEKKYKRLLASWTKKN